MSRWERFRIGWRWFWFGLIVGVAAMLYDRYGWNAPRWVGIYSALIWIPMVIPDAIAQVVDGVARYRSVARRTP